MTATKNSRTRKDGQPDKRYGNKKNHKYCGKRKPNDAMTGSFRVKVRDIIESDDDFNAFGSCFMKREAVFNQIVADPDVRENAVDFAREYSKGNYYTALGNTMHNKIWLTCGLKCNNAWYWHNDAERIRMTAIGVADNRTLAEICSEFDNDPNKSSEIKFEYHKRTGKWRSQMDIKNRCVSEKDITFPEHIDYVLDYGTQAKYTIDANGWDELDDKTTIVKHEIIIGDEEKRYKIPLQYHIPDRLILSPITLINFGKPAIAHDSEYCAKDLKKMQEEKIEPKPWDDLVATIPYWYYPAKIDLDDSTTLGSDAGILKYYCAGIVTDDCFYIENICPSAEVERRNLHIQNLIDEKRALFDKIKRLERLVEHAVEPDKQTVDKLTHLRENYAGVRSNISSERTSLAWLAANELVAAARMYCARNISIEDLRWVGGSGQSWDYGQFASCLQCVCDRYGINLVKVSACRSSKTDPSTGDALAGEDSGDRVVIWGDGSEHDRDGSSGLDLACREPYSMVHVRFAKHVVVDPCGDAQVECRVSRSRVHHDKKKLCADGVRRWGSKCIKASDDTGVVRGYRVDRAAFLSSIRARRDEWREVQRRKNLQRDAIFKFVESSRSVACLSSCRSVKAYLDGVPGCPNHSIDSQTKAKKARKIIKTC